ncbi:MAG TPA: hypothetical protein VNX21_01825, partial [Candidatus Thermoplasmatota archaeon]|nr:hypothetical protein [Candidatus Thermoplasmatota archaeon]
PVGVAWTEGPRPPGRTTAAPWLATRGNATLLAWHEDLGERAALRLARLAGEAWEVVAHLPPHAGELHAANTDLAQFALDREGRALLTWADAEAGEAWLGWADVDGP